ncbi:MAG: hypothetical protein IIA14_13325 [SAR324 cluster bacterium]|nr:hypothetical protein [SAR324 cluster bacterium]
MVARCKNWILLALAMLLLVIAPAGLAQAPAGTSIFSIWVRLSLRGFNQQEIESLLQNLNPKSVENVKARLRRAVLGNLELKKIGERMRKSRDKDDLNSIVSSVETEIRFAGMQNDRRLKLMIKDRFGINLGVF